MQPVKSPHLVPSGGDFDLSKRPTSAPDDEPKKKKLEKELEEETERIAELQRRLYAEDRRSLLLVFQAMDAAGKDSTIRAVFTGVNPAGFQVSSFKQPSKEELDHDFLWRSARRLPERGRIGVFNRSYYEEVLVVRVHPEYLAGQRLDENPSKSFWEDRLESIADHEKHLARNGTRIVKFFLNVSRDEQKQRFLDRLDESHKNWKFSSGDVRERSFWKDYAKAYEQALSATSTDHAPWYAIPADSKPWMRLEVARIVRATLEDMDPQYPEATTEERATFDEMRTILENE